ncbi:MAG: DNA polymerase III subunit chi [Rubrivivax sp.]|nr:DNA polymerase III subunit chi [Rubrivivax sp.]
MTEVEFHTGVADPLAYACRLLRKACRAGVRVILTAPPATLTALDRALWTFDVRDFVPHVRQPGASAAVAARTPIWLAPQAGLSGAPPVLVNLGSDAPEDLAGVERLIEIVSDDADEADRGRGRWRAYKARGLEIVHHRSGASGG